MQVQSRIKQLEKIERIEVDEEDNSSLRLKFVCSSRSGNYPVICEDMEKSYGGHVVFHDVNLTINRGEKVAFVGKNGEGKSTLVSVLWVRLRIIPVSLHWDIMCRLDILPRTRHSFWMRA